MFKNEVGGQGGGKAFVTKGFNQWDKQYQLQTHVGNIGSVYNLCLRASELLMKLNQSIVTALAVQSKEIDSNYKICLTTSFDCIRYLLHQGLLFCGHDESQGSSNRRNFRELLQFLADHNEDYLE